METLQELEQKKDEVFEINNDDTYSTEFQVITVYNNNTWDLAGCSFSTVQEAVDVAREIVNQEDGVSHCMIELQTSINIDSCPDTAGTVVIAYIKKN